MAMSDLFFPVLTFLLCLNIATQDERGDQCMASYCPPTVNCDEARRALFLRCIAYNINPTAATTKKVTTTTKKTTKKATTTTKKTTKKTTTTTKKTTTTTKKTTTTTKKTTTTTTTTTTLPPTQSSWNGTFAFRETISNDQAPCCVRIEYDEETAYASSIPCVTMKSTVSSASITYPSTEPTSSNPSNRTTLSTENVALEKYTHPPFLTTSSTSQFTTFAENTTTNAFLITRTENPTTRNSLASESYQNQSTLPTTVTANDVLSTTEKPMTSSTHNPEHRETTRSFTSEINNTFLPTTTLLKTQTPSITITDSKTTRKLTTEQNQTFLPTSQSTVSDSSGTNTSESVTATSLIFSASNSSVVAVSTSTHSMTAKTTENTATTKFTSTNEPTESRFSSSSTQSSTVPFTEQLTTVTAQTTNTLLPEDHISTTIPQTTQSNDIGSTLIHEHKTSADIMTTSTLAYTFPISTKDIETTSASPLTSVTSISTSTPPETSLLSQSTSITQSATLSTTSVPNTTVAKTTEDMSTSTTKPHIHTSTTDVSSSYGPQTTDATLSSQLETSEKNTVMPTSQSTPTSSNFIKFTDSSSEKSTKSTSTSSSTTFESETSERVTTPLSSSSTASSTMFIKTTRPSSETSTHTTRASTTTTSPINDDSTTPYFQKESITLKTCSCANGGTCNGDGLCVCADGYFGAKCDQTSPSHGVAAAATAVAVVTAVSQSSSSSVKFLWPRYSASVRTPTNPHEFFRLMSTYFLTVALGVNSMFGVPKSSDVKHMPMCAMSYLFGTGAFFLSLTAMIFEAGVDALTLSGAKFNAWTRPAERRPRCFSFWPTMTLYVLVGVAPTAGLWLKHWTDCVTTRSCIGSLGYGDFDRSVKDAAWLQMTVTLFYLGLATVVGILAIACNSFDICRCRRRTEAWSINPYVYGREIWPLEANAYFWLVAIQPVLFGVCWMSYMHVNDAKTVKAQWINLILTTIYSFTSTVQSSLTTSQQLSNTVCSLMTMLPQRFLFLMPSTDHVSLKDKKGILKDQMHIEDWQKFELKELNNGPVPAYPIRYDSIPFGLAQYMCRLWTTNYLKQRASGDNVEHALTTTAKHFLLQLPDLRTINTFEFAHLFCNWAAEVREKDSDSVSHAILQKSLRIMDRQMDLSVPPPMIVVKECGTDTEYRRKISHLTPMDGEDQMANSRKNSKHCDVSLDDTQPAFIGPKTEEHSVSALVPHELFVAFNMDDENIAN